MKRNALIPPTPNPKTGTTTTHNAAATDIRSHERIASGQQLLGHGQPEQFAQLALVATVDLLGDVPAHGLLEHLHLQVARGGGQSQQIVHAHLAEELALPFALDDVVGALAPRRMRLAVRHRGLGQIGPVVAMVHHPPVHQPQHVDVDVAQRDQAVRLLAGRGHGASHNAQPSGDLQVDD